MPEELPPADATSSVVSSPRELGLNPEILERAYRWLAEWTEAGEPRLSAAALAVGRGAKRLPARFFGRMGPESDAAPLRHDAVFPVASLTKPILFSGFMQLVEEGRVGLTDLVGRHLPRFAAAGKQSVRVIHLLTHTSGLPENLSAHPRLRRAHASLEEYLEETFTTTLNFPAGTDLTYSNPGSLIVAEIMRAITGKPATELLRQRIFQPLGMNGTSLGTNGIAEERLVRIATTEGTTDWNSDYWRTLAAPWGGLFTTPDDLAMFASAALSGMKRGGGFLQPTTLRLMTQNLLDSSRLPELSERARRKERWGIGWKLNAPTGSGGVMVDLLGDQVFGHQGMTGAVLWVDPKTELFCVLVTSAGGIRAPWRMAAVSNIVAASVDS
jgi:serine-type D-Ala-D-Ala carboxypeptidase